MLFQDLRDGKVYETRRWEVLLAWVIANKQYLVTHGATIEPLNGLVRIYSKGRSDVMPIESAITFLKSISPEPMTIPCDRYDWAEPIFLDEIADIKSGMFSRDEVEQGGFSNGDFNLKCGEG